MGRFRNRRLRFVYVRENSHLEACWEGPVPCDPKTNDDGGYGGPSTRASDISTIWYLDLCFVPSIVGFGSPEAR